MKEMPLSARLHGLADDLKALADAIYPHDRRASLQAVFLAVRAGLAAIAAEELQRTLRRHERALDEVHCNAQEGRAGPAATPPPSLAHQDAIDAIKTSLPRAIR